MTAPKTTTCFLAAMLLASLAALGCSNDSKPSAPGIEPEVINNTDNFQFQTTALSNYSGALSYTWSNTGPMADVDQSCAVTSGNAVLSLIDASGTTVYEKQLSQGGSFVTTSGTSGDWTIRVDMSQCSGTLNFRADMRPAP